MLILQLNRNNVKILIIKASPTSLSSSRYYPANPHPTLISKDLIHYLPESTPLSNAASSQSPHLLPSNCLSNLESSAYLDSLTVIYDPVSSLPSESKLVKSQALPFILTCDSCPTIESVSFEAVILVATNNCFQPF